MAAITAAASAICGTQVGETNAVASMVFKPAAARRPINSVLISLLTGNASFCKPSRGLTSTIRTDLGRSLEGGMATCPGSGLACSVIGVAELWLVETPLCVCGQFHPVLAETCSQPRDYAPTSALASASATNDGTATRGRSAPPIGCNQSVQ